MDLSYGQTSYTSMKKAIKHLELVCKLSSGYTIDINTCRIVDHSHWYSTYVRSIYNENRYKTILWLEDLFEKISNLVIHLDYLIEKKASTSRVSFEDFELLECIESPDHSEGDEDDSILVSSDNSLPNILNPIINPTERKSELVQLMEKARHGLNSLLETYHEDKIIVSRVKQIITTLCIALNIKVNNNYVTNNFLIRLRTLHDPFRHSLCPWRFQSPVADNLTTPPNTPTNYSDVD